jgi:hypothetical protein
MKLIGYEWWKIGTKRLLYWFVPLLLVGNVWLYVQEQFRTHRDLIAYKSDYMQLVQELSQVSVEEAAGILEKRSIRLLALTLMRDQGHPAFRSQLEDLLAEHPELLEILADDPYRHDEEQLRKDRFLTYLLSERVQAILTYDDYLEGIRQQAETLQSVSIFQDAHSFAYRNIRRTPEDFRHLRGIPLQLGPDDGVVSVARHRAADLFAAAAVFLLCTYLFLHEKETLPLTRVTARGRVPVIAAKLAVLIASTIALSALFYGSTLLAARHLYGFGDLGRYIQSIAAFQQSNLLMTVGQFLAALFAVKTVALMLLALIVAALAVFFHRPGAVYLCAAAFLGASGIAYTTIHPFSYLNGLKYINLFAFFDGFRLLGEYRNLNVFGYPFDRIRISAACAGLLFLVLTVLAVWLYAHRFPSGADGVLQRLWLAMKGRLLVRYRYSIRIWSHEWFKALAAARGYPVLIIAAAIGYSFLEFDELRLSHDDAVYSRYIKELAGPYTEEKMNWIMAEQAAIADVPLQMLRLKQDLEAGRITYSDYLIKENELQAYAAKNKALERVLEQAMHLQHLQQTKGITGSFVSELATAYLFEHRLREQFNALLFAALLLLFLSPVFPMDYRQGMIRVIRATDKGKFPLFLCKLAIGPVAALTLMALLYAPAYWNGIHLYAFTQWDAPIQSVRLYGEVDLPLSIGGFVVLVNGLQLAGGVIMAVCALALSVFVRRQALVLFLGAAVFLTPILLDWIGLTFVTPLSFNKAFFLYSALAADGSIGHVFVYFAALVLIGLGAVALGWRTYRYDPVPARRRLHGAHRPSSQQSL